RSGVAGSLGQSAELTATMRLLWKWMLVSFGGAVTITVALATLPERLVDAPGHKSTHIRDGVVEVILWPVAVCVYLAGHGAPIGPPERHMYEATPVQVIAAFVGIALSWFFYSSLVFLIIWFRKRRGDRRLFVLR